MYRRTRKYSEVRQAAMQAGSQAARNARPAPDYPAQLPALRMRITVERFDGAEVRHVFEMRFDSPEGLLVYKGSTPDWAIDANGGKALEAGDQIKFVGTIKEHADYKGTKQTMVSRCAVVKEKPAKKAKKMLVLAEGLAA